MNSFRLADFQELEELFVDMECLLRTQLDTNDYTEEHYRTHCDFLKRINSKYQKIKKGTIGKYCRDCKNRRTPRRNRELVTEQQKREAYETGDNSIVYCRDCYRFVKRANLKKHKSTKLCKSKRNLKMSAIASKKIYSFLHYKFQGLEDIIDGFCINHTNDIREGINQTIEPELNWVNFEGKWMIEKPPFWEVDDADL